MNTRWNFSFDSTIVGWIHPEKKFPASRERDCQGMEDLFRMDAARSQKVLKWHNSFPYFFFSFVAMYSIFFIYLFFFKLTNKHQVDSDSPSNFLWYWRSCLGMKVTKKKPGQALGSLSLSYVRHMTLAALLPVFWHPYHRWPSWPLLLIPYGTYQ